MTDVSAFNPGHQGGENIREVYFYLLVFVVVLPFLWIGLFFGEVDLIRFFPDDSFYYIQTAWNFSETGIISFDGVNWTNGFHPLFFLITVLFAWLLPKNVLLNGLFLLNVFLVFSAVSLTLKKLEKFLSNHLKILFLLVFTIPVFFSFVWISCGLEAGLVVWATSYFYWSWVEAGRRQFSGHRENLRLGSGMAILMLSRLDLILVLLPFVLFILGRISVKRGELGWREGVSIFAVPFCFGILYLAINLVFTEHLLPISAVVKEHYSKPFSLSWNSSTGGSLAGSILALLPLAGSLTVLLCGFFSRLRKIVPSDHLNGLLLLNLGVLVFSLYLRVFSWHFFFWYFAFPLAAFFLSTAVLAAGLVSKARSPLRWSRTMIWVLGIGVFINVAANGYFLLRLVPQQTNATFHLLQIARQIDRICGPDAVIGTYDAGILGFFTSGRVINLDGLANNFDYLKNHKLPGRFLEYFQAQGMTHYLARDVLLIDRKSVEGGDYVETGLKRDRRVRFRKDQELFRYSIPGNFSVYLFKL